MDNERISVTVTVDARGAGPVRLPLRQAIDGPVLFVVIVCAMATLAGIACGLIAGSMWPIDFGLFMSAIGSGILASSWRRCAHRWASIALLRMNGRIRDHFRN